MSAQKETVATEGKPVAIRSVDDGLPSDLYAVCVALRRNAIGGKREVSDSTGTVKDALKAILVADIKSVLK
jgi:hypothetical protein